MYQEMANWIDSLDLDRIPDEVAGFCFNLYDGCDHLHWSMDLIGADRYDPEDSDWACDEVCDFGSRAPEFRWIREAGWEIVLEEVVAALRMYLSQGKYADALKSRTAAAVGFDDGDLEILHCKS